MRAQRSVVLADGTARQALVMPAAAIDGYQTVLTINGYALVNAEGRVVYALNRESQAQASEPVVVTIMDAEVAGWLTVNCTAKSVHGRSARGIHWSPYR